MAAIRRGRQVLASLIFAASTTVLAATPEAGSVDAGRSLYSTYCFGCHGAVTPLGSPAAAADTPSRIRAAINPQATMGLLKFLTDQNLSDIAAYIARPTTTDIDRLLDWAEQLSFPNLLGTPAGPSQSYAGYRYRYYPRAGVFIGAKDSDVYLLDASTLKLSVIGSVRQFLSDLPKGR